MRIAATLLLPLVTALTGSALADDGFVVGERIRVQVRGGGTAEGVVLAQGTWERRDPVQGWVAAKAGEAGAGVRLWWVKDLNGFQFVLAAEVASTKSLGVLSAEETAAAERRRTEASERAAAERANYDAEKAKAAEAEEKAKSLLDQVDQAKREAEAAVLLDLSKKDDAAKVKRWAELLAKYPPERWTPETPAEIERRKIVLHVFPSEDEKAFLADFAEWKEAQAAWAAAQKKAADTKTAAAGKPAAAKTAATEKTAPAPAAKPAK